MTNFLQFFIWMPLTAFVISLLIPRRKESLISGLVITTAAIHLAAVAVLILFWMVNDFKAMDRKHITLFQSGNIEIFIDFYFDKVTAAFCAVGSLIAILVSVYSRFYMHRDEGFKRYFATILLFFLGYNLIIYSGNFETLFVGWEILGICSFLLIAFYRDRYLPVKNGLKVISFFRLADVCLLLAMWMSHHLWHENITFIKMNDLVLVQERLHHDYGAAFFIALTIFFAAAIKSAQLPFSSWLPRAMEGPTSSSAIFYGSLSVHLGVFILLRTYPFWESLAFIKGVVVVTGIATAIVATGIARVQATVKTQIAYSSAAQIGIMFIEVALGFHIFALIHFAGNAFLRTYQLLVSPSVMSYLIHDQFYHFSPRAKKENNAILKKVTATFYILSVKEWNLDFLLQRFLWSPFKWLGNRFEFLHIRLVQFALLGISAYGLYFFFMGEELYFYRALPYLFSFLALAMILKAFTERGDARRSLLMVFASQFFLALSIALNSTFDRDQIAIYLSGGIVSVLIGYICLNKTKSLDGDINLDKFHGYAYEQPRLALIFFLSCLGLVAFPITPAFIGFDVLLTHIEKDQVMLIIFPSLCFVFIELSVLRIYARIFMGQHKKPYHAMAYRSS